VKIALRLFPVSRQPLSNYSPPAAAFFRLAPFGSFNGQLTI
jgi:hypothetical protein